ncbi:MAG: hypothetical protein ABH879_05995 [archaeon]
MFAIRSKRDRNSAELAAEVMSYLKDLGQAHTTGTDADMVIAVGDDALILETFRDTKDTPVLGIAVSSSFLAEANRFNYQDCLRSIARGEYEIVEKTRIAAEISGEKTPPALNDIGVFPLQTASLIRYSLHIDGKFFWKDTADGLFVSTPTGSTGHSLSSGGPIIVNEPRVLSLIPILTMDRTHTPLVIPDSAAIEVSDIQSKTTVLLIIDGEVRIPLTGNRVVIRTYEHSARFVKLSDEPIETKLRKRTVRVDSKIKLLSPSAKLIYTILTQHKELTQKEITSESYLPARTVRHALGILLKLGAVKKRPYLQDARQAVYSV